MAVEGAGKKTLRSPCRDNPGRIKREEEKKKRLSLTCDLASRIMPTRYVHLRESDPGKLFLSPHTSFLPLLLSFKSCCSERLLLPAASTQASQEDWRAFSRNWSVGEACTESAPSLPWMKRPRPRAASGVAGPPPSSLGSQVPTPRSLLPTLQTAQGGDLGVGRGAVMVGMLQPPCHGLV